MISYDDTGFKIYPIIPDRLAIEINRCLQEALILEWITKRKTTLIKKDPQKRSSSHQLQTRPILRKISNSNRDK